MWWDLWSHDRLFAQQGIELGPRGLNLVASRIIHIGIRLHCVHGCDKLSLAGLECLGTRSSRFDFAFGIAEFVANRRQPIASRCNLLPEVVGNDEWIGRTTPHLKFERLRLLEAFLELGHLGAEERLLVRFLASHELRVLLGRQSEVAREDNELVASFLGRLELECGVVSLTYERAELSGRRGSQVVHPRANAA